MRRPITKHTKIIPYTHMSGWSKKMYDEGVSVVAELKKFDAYVQKAGYDDIIPGEVSFGNSYAYFPNQKTYHWFLLRWGA
jgi:hypothetical protein